MILTVQYTVHYAKLLQMLSIHVHVKDLFLKHLKKEDLDQLNERIMWFTITRILCNEQGV